MGTENQNAAMRAGKEMHQEPTHGHRRVGEDNEDAKDTRSVEQIVKEDPPPAHGMKPEDILAMDNIPDDPKEIEKLLGTTFGDKSREDAPEGDAPAHKQADAIDKGDAKAFEDATQTPDESTDSTPKVEPTKPAAAPATAKAAPNAQADGGFVETSDGKGRIPYAVLKTERANNAALSKQLAEATALIEQLRARPAAGEAASTKSEQEEQQEAVDKAALQGLTAEELQEVRENFPTPLIKVIERLDANAKAGIEAQAKLREIEKEAETVEAAERHTQAQSVQDIIDQDPVLTELQQDPDRWADAVALDDSLRSTKRWGGKPFVERMVEVKRLMGFTAEPTRRDDDPKPTAEQQAAAKLAAAAKKQTQGRAFTHSDLPGGNPPAQSERESAAQMSVHDLASRVEKMTPAQLDRYLASIG